MRVKAFLLIHNSDSRIFEGMCNLCSPQKKELQKTYVHYQLSFKLGPVFADEKEEFNLYVPLGTCVVSPNTAGEEESNDNKTREIYVDNKEHELDNETVSVKENSGKKAI